MNFNVVVSDENIQVTYVVSEIHFSRGNSLETETSLLRRNYFSAPCWKHHTMHFASVNKSPSWFSNEFRATNFGAEFPNC
jgi:hypothetical protein